jgi:hypothetical protein
MHGKRALSKIVRESRPIPLPPCSSRTLARRRFATAADVTNVVKPARFGQPHTDSHPHLLKRGELTPGIDSSEFETRRSRLMDSLPNSSIVVCIGANIKYMSQGKFVHLCNYAMKQLTCPSGLEILFVALSVFFRCAITHDRAVIAFGRIRSFYISRAFKSLALQ